MKVLLTGFENFLQHPYNPTEKIVSLIEKKSFNQHQITTSILPVCFDQARLKTRELILQDHYDFHIALGLAASRRVITPEVIAVNIAHNPGRPDNKGHEQYLTPLKPGASNALMSTLPLKKIETLLSEKQHQHELSFTAGTYVCNAVMFEALHCIKENNLSTRSGFIHLPPDKGFAMDGRDKGPTLEELKDAVETIMRACLS
jgi:pyroglutamyl-peptidase